MIIQTHTPTTAEAIVAPHILATTFDSGFSVPPAGTPLNITFSQDINNNSFDFGSFPGVTWDYGDQENMSFACADLSHGTFLNAPLNDCDLSYANLTDCIFGNIDQACNISYCSLAHADCTGSTFTGNTDDGFGLNFADCTGTIFRNCTFNNVAFLGGGFIGADFTGATFSDDCTFGLDAGAMYIFDSTTVWPAGFDTSVFPATRSTYYDFSGQTLTPGTDFSDTFLGHANFQDAILQDVHLSLNCAWANFSGAQLLGHTFGADSSSDFQPSSFPNLCWANLSDATIDFGPSSADQIASVEIVVPITTHANFSNAKFIWSGATSYPDTHFLRLTGANHAYTNFNGITAPEGFLLTFVESNCAHCTFVGAQLGPTDHFVSDGFPIISGNNRNDPIYDFVDVNFCYADFTDCQGGWFGESDLSYAKFTNANMPYTSFSETYIGYADFTGAIVGPRAFYGSISDYGRPNGGSSQFSLSGGSLTFSGLLTTRPAVRVAAIYVAGADPGVCTPPGDGTWQEVAVYDNAASGGNGWLSIWTSFFQGAIESVSSPPSTVTFTTDATGLVAGLVYEWEPEGGVLQVQFLNGNSSSAAAPSVDGDPTRNGQTFMAVFFSPTSGVFTGDFADSISGNLIIQEASTYEAHAAGFLPLTDSSGPIEATMSGSAPWVAVSMSLDPEPAQIPALYNSHTILPAGVDLSRMRPALTVQNDSGEAFWLDDCHQDFSNQTIDPTVVNINGFFEAFGADFNHCHFLGEAYGNLEAYNSNFEGATFDPGFFFVGDVGSPSLDVFSTFSVPGAASTQQIAVGTSQVGGGAWAFIGDGSSHNVYVVDLNTQAVVKTLDVGGAPGGICAGPPGYVFLTVDETDLVAIYMFDNDPTNITVAATRAGVDPGGMYYLLYDSVSGYIFANGLSNVYALSAASFSTGPITSIGTSGSGFGGISLITNGVLTGTFVYAVTNNALVYVISAFLLVVDTISITYFGTNATTNGINGAVYVHDGAGIRAINPATNAQVGGFITTEFNVIGQAQDFLFTYHNFGQLGVFGNIHANPFAPTFETVLTVGSGGSAPVGIADVGNGFIWVTTGADATVAVLQITANDSSSYQSHWGGPSGVLARGVGQSGERTLAVRQPVTAIHVPSVTSLTTGPR